MFLFDVPSLIRAQMMLNFREGQKKAKRQKVKVRELAEVAGI